MQHLLMKHAERLSSVFYQQGLSELPLDQEMRQSKVASVLSAKILRSVIDTCEGNFFLPDAQWEAGALVKIVGQYQEN